MVIDFHTHVFPEKMVEAAVGSLEKSQVFLQIQTDVLTDCLPPWQKRE